MRRATMWILAFVFGVLLNAKLASSKIDEARPGWLNQQAQLQEFFSTLNRELLSSKHEQLSTGIRYTFFNNQPELMAEFDARLEAADDLTAKLNLVNNLTGTELFAVSNGNVTVQKEGVQSFILAAAINIFEKQFPNPEQREAAIESVRLKLERNIAEVAERLEPVSLDALSASMTERRLSRTRRDIGTVISNIFKSIIQFTLTQVQSLFDAFMQNITTLVTNLYIGDQQTNLILSTVSKYANQIILEITQLLVNIQTWGDSLIKNLITQSSRRRREISYLDAGELAWDLEPRVDLVNCRSKRDIASSVVAGITGFLQLILSAFSPLTTILNNSAKNIFIAVLAAQYQFVGKFVLYPVRLIFETIVDTVLPCATCASIV